MNYRAAAMAKRIRFERAPFHDPLLRRRALTLQRRVCPECGKALNSRIHRAHMKAGSRRDA